MSYNGFNSIFLNYLNQLTTDMNVLLQVLVPVAALSSTWLFHEDIANSMLNISYIILLFIWRGWGVIWT